MLKCWQLSTTDRPTFSEIRHYLSDILERYYDDYYLLLDRRCDYYNFGTNSQSTNETTTTIQKQIDQNLTNIKIDINIRKEEDEKNTCQCDVLSVDVDCSKRLLIDEI